MTPRLQASVRKDRNASVADTAVALRLSVFARAPSLMCLRPSYNIHIRSTAIRQQARIYPHQPVIEYDTVFVYEREVSASLVDSLI